MTSRLRYPYAVVIGALPNGTHAAALAGALADCPAPHVVLDVHDAMHEPEPPRPTIVVRAMEHQPFVHEPDTRKVHQARDRVPNGASSRWWNKRCRR